MYSQTTEKDPARLTRQMLAQAIGFKASDHCGSSLDMPNFFCYIDVRRRYMYVANALFRPWYAPGFNCPW